MMLAASTLAASTTGESVGFWILAPIAALAAIAMVLAKNAVHAALFLAAVMLSLAGLYALQDAPFLAAVQVIVYTGAILMLFLFVLMLVGVDASDSLYGLLHLWFEAELGRHTRWLAASAYLEQELRPRLRDLAIRGYLKAESDHWMSGIASVIEHPELLSLLVMTSDEDEDEEDLESPVFSEAAGYYRFRAELAQHEPAVVDPVDDEIVLPERLHQPVGQGLLVFDQEDPHGARC